MDGYYDERYGLPRQASGHSNGLNQSLDGMDIAGYEGQDGQTRRFSGPQAVKEEDGNQAQPFGSIASRRGSGIQHQLQGSNMAQPPMMQFGNNSNQPTSQQFSPADLSPFEFVPSNDMSNSAMPQEMLMQAGAIFNPHSQQPFPSNQGYNGSQPLGPGQGLNIMTGFMNNSDQYNIASPAYSSPMVQNSAMGMNMGAGMGNGYNMQGSPVAMNFPQQEMHGMVAQPAGEFNLAPQQQYQRMNSTHSQTSHFGRHDSFPDDPGGGQQHSHRQQQQQQQHQNPQPQPSQPSSRRQSMHLINQQQQQQRMQQQQQQPNQQPQPQQQHPQPEYMHPNMELSNFQPESSRRQSMHSKRQMSDPRTAQSIANAQRFQNPTNNSYNQGANTNHAFNSAMALKAKHMPPPGGHTNAYSSSGFDMLSVLMRVATRQNPEINIGAVDLSCAFVVCDADEHDFPIVYCSDNFERLTGYSKYEILGRNCRFLQAPDGRVQAGVRRSYVDDGSVLYLKNMITARKEAQVSLINYRKGGQPFLNLLTMIPVCWDTNEVKYFVGFQVDLVEQPGSVTTKNPDGSYQVNYQRGLQMPRYVFENKDMPPQLDAGQSVSRDDVSTVLTSITNGESELSKRIWDKVLLENTDDVVFVLSLKGLFLYLSPSAHRVLEYDPSELSGTALSSVCHPSDIVPVTRELKESASADSVDVVFRIRRKEHGYMWFEGHGSLHTEQGKGRKSIVLVGRERPVYALNKNEILASGGINDNEIWSKISTTGIFLFVPATVRQLLDRLPSDMIATSIQSLMRHDSRADFNRILDIARTGKRADCKHELMNKRGQVLQAFSTVYPGDASEGTKPTFLIVQTRLIKYVRPSGSSSRSNNQVPKLERSTSSMSLAGGIGDPTSPRSTTSASPFVFGAALNYDSSKTNTPRSLASPSRYVSTFDSATTFAGQQALALGHQDAALASEENLFDELKTTRSTSWQFELRQMEKRNRLLGEELQSLLAARKKRKRRKAGAAERDCANCHTKQTPEWRRGPSGARDLCNSCGLRWAKQQGRISPRTKGSASQGSASPASVVGQTSQTSATPGAAGSNKEGSRPASAFANAAAPSASNAPNAAAAEALAGQGHSPSQRTKQSASNPSSPQMAQKQRNPSIDQTLADAEKASKADRRRSLDAASASRRGSTSTPASAPVSLPASLSRGASGGTDTVMSMTDGDDPGVEVETTTSDGAEDDGGFNKVARKVSAESTGLDVADIGSVSHPQPKMLDTQSADGPPSNESSRPDSEDDDNEAECDTQRGPTGGLLRHSGAPGMGTSIEGMIAEDKGGEERAEEMDRRDLEAASGR